MSVGPIRNRHTRRPLPENCFTSSRWNSKLSEIFFCNFVGIFKSQIWSGIELLLNYDYDICQSCESDNQGLPLINHHSYEQTFTLRLLAREFDFQDYSEKSPLFMDIFARFWIYPVSKFTPSSAYYLDWKILPMYVRLECKNNQYISEIKKTDNYSWNQGLKTSLKDNLAYEWIFCRSSFCKGECTKEASRIVFYERRICQIVTTAITR